MSFHCKIKVPGPGEVQLSELYTFINKPTLSDTAEDQNAVFQRRERT